METGNLSSRSAEPASRLHRGTNQSGMRDSNERLVLSLVRRNGSLAKTEIARMTGLSAQTVSVIMRELEEEGLLELIPSGGFSVKAFSERDIYDAIEIRGTLEGLAARLCAERGC